MGADDNLFSALQQYFAVTTHSAMVNFRYNGHSNATRRLIGLRAPGLLESLLLLALVVTGAIVGLTLRQDWSKIPRVASASVGYFTALFIAMRSPLVQTKTTGVFPFWPFCLAGASAGLLSAVVRPSTSPAMIVVQVLGAALLLGGVHWVALRCWIRIRSRLEF